MRRDAATFEAHRPALLALAWRMLGEVARAEDVVQEAWVRFATSEAEIDAPRAFLATTVTRLCLDELGSARARKEESRSDRLPEPIDLGPEADRVDTLDRVSMAFVVLLQRLTPAERAVLLLHEVFDTSHAEIAVILGKTELASRKLLARAREHVATEKRAFAASEEDHRRLLGAFVAAVARGEQSAFEELLADDAVLAVDAGPEGGRFGKIRNVGRPVVGATRIAALLGALVREGIGALATEEHTINGEPAVLVFRGGALFSAIFVAVADDRIRHVYVHTDPDRLRHLAPARHAAGPSFVSIARSHDGTPNQKSDEGDGLGSDGGNREGARRPRS